MANLPARGMRRTLTHTDPSTEFEDIYERMGQLVNAAFGDVGAIAAMPWSPPADLTESDNAYIVHVELPGVRKDQINVQIAGRELMISGEIKEESSGNGQRIHRSSRRTGQFEYRVAFPGDIKAQEVSAELADGVLTVTVPKLEAAAPSRIEVTEDANSKPASDANSKPAS
jgi:HSP20 family protein